MQGMPTEKEACTASGDSSRLVFASNTQAGNADTTMELERVSGHEHEQHETSDGQIQLTVNIDQQLRSGKAISEQGCRRCSVSAKRKWMG